MFQDTTPFILALIITFTVLICIAIWNSINSRPPYEKGPPPTPGPSRTREILSRFSQFYNNLSPEDGCIYDAAILPDPKQHIIHALYVGYDESESEEDRDAIERGLNAIVNFQELVGEEPLLPIENNDTNSLNNLPTEALFNNEENNEEFASEEEKKYNEFLNKRDDELLEHYNHLKIEPKNEEEEKAKEWQNI